MNLQSLPTVRSFNPYSCWFGISAEERPLNAYQLLGLPALETNHSRIQAAIERRRNQLELHRNCEDQQILEQVAGELAAAERTLTIREDKSILDAAIRRQQKLDAAFDNLVTDDSQTLTCPECENDNPGSRRFCSTCGQALWTFCGRCQRTSHSSERYCGGCGADIASTRAESQAAAAALLDEAQQLRSREQWQQALQVALQVATLDEPHVQAVAEGAIHLWSQWQMEFQQLRASAESLEREALELWKQNQSEAAQQRLHPVSRELLSAAGRELLSSINQRRDEIDSLEKQIKDCIQGKLLDRLGILLDRLLLLDPRHAQATKLAQQLAATVRRRALKKYAEGKYQTAADVLEQTPQVARDADFETLTGRLTEVLSLYRQIQQAPFVTDTLLGIAERLSTRVPADATVAKWRRELLERHQRGQWQKWVQRPSVSAVGIPASLWCGPSRIGVHPQHRDQLATDAGIFAVAFGLALQGLGLAAIPTKIGPERRSVFSSIPLTRHKRAAAAWGIDIGRASIKAVRLVMSQSTEPHVDAVVVVPHNNPIGRTTAEDQAIAEVRATLAKLAEKAKFANNQTVVSIWAGETLLRSVSLPPASGKQLKLLVEQQAKHLLPVELDSVYWDAHTTAGIQPAASQRGSGESTVSTFVAVRRQVADTILAACREHFQVDVLQSAAVALHNLFAYECGARPADSGMGILDLGAGNTSLVIIAPQITWCRSGLVCGESVCRTVVRDLHLTHEQARLAIAQPLRVKRIDLLCRAMAPVFQELAAELRRSLDVFRREYPHVPVEKLYLVGGASRIHGLLGSLWFGS